MVALRRAQPADNAALLDLFGHVPMAGKLVLTTRREPDFFALYEMQRADYECWVYEADGRLGGMGTLLVRDAWLEGKPCRVGYLGDLRSHFQGSRRVGLAHVYGELFEGAKQRYGCEVFLTTVLASNTVALNSLVRRRQARAQQPYYHLLRRFAAVAVHFLRRRPAPASSLHVRRATAADLTAITAFLDAEHRSRPFGYRFDQGEFAHRLAHWPGLTLASTYLAYDAGGQLLGCTSAWDPSAVKQYRVHAYHGHLLWSKRGFNTIARLLGAPRLPSAGENFRALYLCHTSIRNDDPNVLRALLERIYADFGTQGYHFFLLCIYEHDPLTPALRGFFTRALDFHLYAVSSSQAPRTTYPQGRPGFEMVLA